eukprot:271552-Karenia_brevis.AAC.1
METRNWHSHCPAYGTDDESMHPKRPQEGKCHHIRLSQISLRLNVISFSATISACEKRVASSPNVISFRAAVISACKKSGQWQRMAP